MKPLNLDNSPCSPISSNCVIWQGPDIPCIKLCKGDTVSDVVYKLATELCTIMDTLNITNYDLSCFDLVACPPADFQALINFLIQRICALENITPTTTPGGGSTGCPECYVNYDICFGGGSGLLADYVELIGIKVCSLVADIADLQDQINSLDDRVTALEDAPAPVFTIPSFEPDCAVGTLPAGNQFINLILEAFINDVWCGYFAATGSTADLISAVNAICIADTDLQLTTGTPFSANPNWIQNASYDTVADAINNIWVALCDVYTYASTVIASVAAAAAIPTGSVMPWAGTGGIAPTGWAFCDGGTLDRVVYSTLFATIGTAYGPGDGVTTFNLPDLQQRIPVGLGSDAGGYSLSSIGDTGGSVSVTLSASEIPVHTHNVNIGFTSSVTGSTSTDGSHTHSIWADPDDGAGSPESIDLSAQPGSTYAAISGNDLIQSAGSHNHTVTGTGTGTVTGNTGDGSPALQSLPHGNMQPYLVMRYIIKL